MSGFNASASGPQRLAENSARQGSVTPHRIVRAKLKRAMRRGIVSREAAERHAPTIIIAIGRRRHDYRREGAVKDDTVEGSMA